MADGSKELEREAARLRDRAIAMQEQMLRFMREMGAALDVLDQDTRALSQRVAAAFAKTEPPPPATKPVAFAEHADQCSDCRFLRSEAMALLYSGQCDSLDDALAALVRGWKLTGAKLVSCPEALKFGEVTP